MPPETPFSFSPEQSGKLDTTLFFTQTWPQLVTTQAARTPHAPALQTVTDQGTITLTYAALEKKANQLGRFLQQSGIGPEKIVAVCRPRSAHTLICFLAILKAGGVYLPLDPTYPPSRLNTLLADAQPTLLITHPHTPPLQTPGQTITLENPLTQLASMASTPLPSPITPANSAYLIYTSGTTGQPKGVLVPHQALLNHTMGLINRFQLTATDRVLQFASLSFDVALEEICPTWAVGAALVLKPAALPSFDDFTHLLHHQALTVVNIPTPYWQAWVSHLAHQPPPTLPATLRLLAAGSEKGFSATLTQWQHIAGDDIAWHNGYGPTEATITASTFHAPASYTATHPTIPIGRPLNRVQFYTLDAHLQPVSPGQTGELYIGGPGLAHGYWRRPRQTAAAFIPHPFSPQPGQRLYKTGDLVRRLPSDDFTFIGRIDNQVKVRGFRIELGEIEAALNQHPQVESALVRLQKDAAAHTQLVAYVCTSHPLPPADLHHFLAARLPTYMIPAAYGHVTHWPLLPSGKIDHRALPPITIQDTTAPYTPPRTPIEKQLVTIWQTVFQGQPIGIHDNFFEWGGDSLHAVHILSRIKQELGVALPLPDLFTHPTIAALATCITQAEPTTPPPLMHRADRSQPIPLSFGQSRLWFFYQLEPQSSLYNLPLAWHIRGPLQTAVLERALNALVERHEALRTTFSQTAAHAVQHIHPHHPFSLPIQPLAAAQLQKHLDTEAHTPFDLEKGPLYRFNLFQLDPEAFVLTFTTPHIISDGWSQAVFVRHLHALYHAFATHQPDPLPPLPYQYVDYAAAQRRWLTEATRTRLLTYWQNKLADAPPLVTIPPDFLRPSKPQFRGAAAHITIPAATTTRLKQCCQQAQATLFMGLVAAFKLLVQRQTGQSDILIGTPTANRTQTGSQDIIGFFINTLVLRTHLHPDHSFRTWLAQVRETTLEAYAHQALPFDLLVRHLQPQRTQSHAPLFQLFFNMLNLPHEAWSSPPLTLEEIPRTETVSMFDMTLYAQEKADTIHLHLVYNKDLYRPERIESLLAHYQAILQQVSHHPHQPLAHLSLRTPDTTPHLPDPRRPLTAATYQPLPLQVAAQCQQTPTQTAVVTADHTWTYAQVHQQALAVRAHLRQAGVQPGEVVAIVAQREAALVWAILGIWYHGARFVIVDPSYPQAHLTAVVSQVAPTYFIRIHPTPPLPTLIPPQQELVLAAHTLLTPDDQTPAAVEGHTDAYIAFTSGTMGKPRGICGQHAPLSHFIAWHTRQFNLTAQDRFSFLAGLAHDPLIRDIFTPLTLGAALHIPTPAHLQNGPALARWLQTEAITIMHLTPALGKVLAQAEAAPCPLPALRYAFFGGEQLTAPVVTTLQARASQVTCVNFYGTTETPQAIAFHAINTLEANAAIPIGQGIDGVQLLICAPNGRLAAVGEPGEIYVRTPYLARGYWQDEALTRQKFIPNPWGLNPGGTDPNDRLYRTGDHGVYRPDGAVIWQGRTDNQVNLHGFRIELEEIEVALNQHPQVQGAIVILDNTAVSPRLIAYIVGQPDAIEIPQLRHFLRSHLPPYMIPAAFVVLDRFPLTPNNKVDTHALPLPTPDTAATAYTAPRTPTETQLAHIWTAVLHIDPIGIHDNFFERGGDSISGIHIVAKAQEAGLPLSLSDLFEYQTIAALAVTAEANTKTAVSPAPSPPSSPDTPTPFSRVNLNQEELDDLLAELDDLL